MMWHLGGDKRSINKCCLLGGLSVFQTLICMSFTSNVYHVVLIGKFWIRYGDLTTL